MRSSERRFLSSTLAAYGSQLGRVLIRAAGDLALARIVLPDAVGVYELALAFAVIAAIVRDLGLPYELVRHPRRPYGAVLAWEVGAGLVLAAGLTLASPFTAGLDARLPAVLAVYAWWVLLDGLAVVPRVYFECEMEVGRLVAPEVARGAVIAVVSIALAFAGAGVWSLVAGQLVGAAVFAILLWRRAWGRVPLRLTRAELATLPELIARSFYLFLIALAALPLPQVSKLIVGSELGTRTGAFWTGQYNKAREWGFRLQELVLPAVARVLYPALIEYRHKHQDRGRYLAAYRLGTVTLLGLQTLGAYVLSFNAEVVLVRILIGPRWASAVPLVQVLCFAPLVDPFSPLGGELLKTEGQDRAWFAIVGLNVASLTGFGILLTHRLGAVGMAWANYLLLGGVLMGWRVYRICGGSEFGRLTRDLLYLYLVPLPLFALVAWWLPAGWARLAASVPAAAIVLVLYLARFRGPFRAFFSGAPEPAAATESAIAAEIAGEIAGDPTALPRHEP